jgi:hypothetical protein
MGASYLLLVFGWEDPTRALQPADAFETMTQQSSEAVTASALVYSHILAIISIDIIFS